jgi:hypothetical protein
VITIEFVPWKSFYARKNQAAISSWLKRIGEAGEKIFKSSMGGSPPSAPGDWPANRTGTLRSSIGHVATDDSVTIGSSRSRAGAPVSLYLRHGTSRMARRKMSDNAMQEAQASAGRLTKWVEWSHG